MTAMLSASLAIGTFTVPAEITAADNLLAFPGAEGGGKYTLGARGSSSVSVYHVTNLNDSGAGSLREAISDSGRIVVFDVGGVINLNSQLQFTKNNITVLGQTAPGDGITITGNDVLLGNGVENIIIRYLRIRPTDSSGGEPDGIGGRWAHNIILDHCSVSWSVDETLTLYAGSLETRPDVSENITVQYCLTSESLRMSNHFKGAHGYGGIVGGTNATYSHNLFAHHDSRSPRFDRNLKSTDFVNNVIYDWGNTNSLYGAEPYSYNKAPEYSTPDYVSNVNIRNNYYKYGPSTRPAYRSRLFEVTNDASQTYNGEVLKSNLYIKDNYVYGSSAATNNNTASSSYVSNKENANLLTASINMGDYEIEIESAENAYNTVLDNVGATLPRRDEIDARVVADVRNGTGRIINTDEEVGGLAGIQSETRSFEIPSEWKAEHGMGSASETALAPSGYTWLEEYVNDWTAQQEAPSNPDITVRFPSVSDASMTYDSGKKLWTVTDKEEPITYDAVAVAKEGTEITKMELWDGTELIASYNEENSIFDEIPLEPGVHYLMSKAYNDRGERTESPVSIVYVTDNNLTNITEIGAPLFGGKGAAWENEGKTYIAGSGLINGASDSCSYMYYPVEGDFEYTVKIDDIPKYENSVLAGIMFREMLDAGSRMIMVSDTWYKYGENIVVPVRSSTGGSVSFKWFKDSSGSSIANTSSYESTNYPLPKYMRIARSGSTVTVSVSNNGISWTNNSRQPMTIDVSGWSSGAYIGLACDSANGTTMSYEGSNGVIPPLPWFTIASFSDINAQNVEGVPTPAPGPTAPPYDDPNTLPTTKPMTEAMTVNVSDYNLGASSSKEFGSTTLLLDDYMRLYSTSGKTSYIESGFSKTFDGVEYPLRLRFGGGGNFSSEIPSYRIAEVMPAYDGTMKVCLVNNGTSGSRTMALRQNGAEISTKTVGAGETGTLEAAVTGGSRVYMYSQNSGMAIYAVVYEPSAVPTSTINPTDTPTVKPTDTPTPTVNPTDTPTVKPTDTPTPTVDPTDTPTVKPTDTPTPMVKPTDTPTPTVNPTDAPIQTVAPTEVTTPTVKPTDTPSPTNIPTAKPEPCVKLTAHYDENYVLTGLEIEETTTDKAVPEFTDDRTKIMFWDSLTGMKPIRID
ncbi:MAG: hypothetical protein ACI4DP_05060 [Candidatus Ornithomonoglobus sp.]